MAQGHRVRRRHIELLSVGRIHIARTADLRVLFAINILTGIGADSGAIDQATRVDDTFGYRATT